MIITVFKIGKFLKEVSTGNVYKVEDNPTTRHVIKDGRKQGIYILAFCRLENGDIRAKPFKRKQVKPIDLHNPHLYVELHK